MKALSLFLLLTGSLAAQPTVTKVEPPNWWTGTTVSPIRLLIRGENLTGAAVSGDLPASRLSVNARGTYLFVDLAIAGTAKPGAHPLTLRTPQGTVQAPFELLPPTAKPAGISADDVIYLIMPDRFSNGDPANDSSPETRNLLDLAKPRYYHGGDFKGIRDHLAYFKDLGVTALWLNPWYDNVNHLNEREMPEGQPITDYHGYGAVDFYGVEEHFGSLRDLQEMVAAAHAQGIKMVQDQVANHTGPYHPWVTDPPSAVWFNGTATNHIKETWQLWPLIDPYSPPALRAQTLNGWFADILPDLNQDDPEVARYLVQNTLWWIGITGLDAIRMDTLPYVPRAFWKQWMTAIAKEYPNVNVIGEVFDPDPAVTSSFQDGALSVFDFPNYFKVRDTFIKGKTVRDLAGMLAHDGLYKNPDALGTFIGNHDVARFMSEDGATMEKLKLAFTWLLTSRGVPTIYYGDEIAIQGGNDPDNRRDFPVSAFSKATRTADQQSVWELVQRLTKLRAATPALKHGKTVNLCVTEQQWVYSRSVSGETALIEINNADTPAKIACGVAGPLPRTAIGSGSFGDELAPRSARVSVSSGQANR